MASKKNPKFAKNRNKDKISSKKVDDEEDFSVHTVIDLGGDQEDYELLKNINAEEEFETGELPKSADEEIHKNELKQMIKTLGLDSVTIEPDTNGFDEKNADKKLPKNGKTDELNNNSDPLPKSSVNSTGTDVKVGDKLLVYPAARWYEESQIDTSTKKQPSFEKSLVERMSRVTESLWQNEMTIYQKEKENSKSSDHEWLKTMATSGTLGDKIASLAIQIQESAIHNIKMLDILLGMANKKGRRECLMAIDTLKDLWLVNLLPSDRKLRQFVEFPLSNEPKRTNQSGRDAWKRKLILWYFEDQLKKRYEAFIKGMERLLHDNLETVRSKMLGIVYELLSEKPEQEKLLLLYLVNKVGDPNRKIASKAGHLLGCLVQKHPNMKLIIVQEVERLLYRPNIGLKAQYYAVCFLNQLILTKKESVLASRLITIYFGLFKAFVDKGQVESKMLSGLLSGVNRAFPYVQEDEDKFSEQVNMLFRIVHIAPFNTSVQALMLLFQVMDSRQTISDRYYQALYTKLLDPQLRMSSKQAMFLNNIYKSLKVDPSVKRIKAFIKRLLQVCSTQQPSFICGVLYLLSEVGKVKPGIKSLVTQPEDQDEEEHFRDVIDTSDNPDTTEAPDIPINHNRTDNVPTADPVVHATGHVFRRDSSHAHGYQPNARNPLYCGAENACLWEVIKLTKHYHPSVSRFAQSLLQGEDIQYNGDPLMDFTLMRFLDRFVYKNPKKKQKEHGGSLMQPKSVSQRLSEQPVNTAAFLNKSEENVREDELFFYRYFKRKAEQESGSDKKKKVQQLEDADNEEESGDETIGDNEMDFATEFKKSKTTTKPKKKKNIEADDSNEELSDDGEEFDYGQMEFSEDELHNDSDEKKVNFTDKDFEKVLLENLSSDEFSDNDLGDSTLSKRKRKKTGSSEDLTMFAAAEEFAHLLENSRGGGGADDIDMKGASAKQQQWELSRMEDNGRNFRGKQNRSAKTMNRRKGKQNNRTSGRKGTRENTNRKRNRK